ncbi:MAG: hypothetical protein IKZ52_02845 [Bacteroidales bacterium]|nr:hypothetical protein [Bacteroidales bacterium]
MEAICHRLSILIITTLIILDALSGSAQVALQDILYTNAMQGFPAARCMLTTSYAHAGFRNDYGLKEMMFGDVEYDYIHQQDALLASASHYGYSGFGELNVSIGYGRRFGGKVCVALQAVYLMNHAEHYPMRQSFTIDFSAYCQISRTLGLAVDLFNPIRMKYGVIGEEVIPMIFALQANYQPNEKILFALYGEKTLPGTLDAGLEMYYHPLPNLMVSGTAALSHCGIGILIPWKQIIFSIEANWHYRVSVTTQGDVGYYFGK